MKRPLFPKKGRPLRFDGARISSETIRHLKGLFRLNGESPIEALKILSGALLVDQSALTEKSLPVEAIPPDILYSSSIVKCKEAQCLVVDSGRNSWYGAATELVEIAWQKCNQDQIMLSMVRYMTYLGIAALAAVAAAALPGGIGIPSPVSGCPGHLVFSSSRGRNIKDI